MRAVVQRVKRACVKVDGKKAAEIGKGLVVLLGVARGDSAADAAYLARKVAGLRIFDDAEGKLNLSVHDIGGAILAVSQFTLLANCLKGRRPSYAAAAPAQEARGLFDEFVRQLSAAGMPVATGVFQAVMEVELTNWGPVTIILESLH